MIPILILAAGQSARMLGQDKLLQQVAGEALIHRQARQALTLGGPVFVALGVGQTARAAAVADLDVTIMTVPEAAEGMSGTMRGAVAQLPEAPAFMMILGDLVALEVADLLSVYQAYQDAPDHLIWRGATSEGKHGHPIIFARQIWDGFAKLSGDGGGESLVDPLRDRTYLVPLTGNRARLDLDTPEDWENWRASNR